MRTPLLVVSLLANVVLIGVLFLRPAALSAPPVASAPASADADRARAQALAALQQALASGDADALATAGVSAETIRRLRLGSAIDQLFARMQRLRDGVAKDDRYWRTHRSSAESRAQMVEMRQAQREFMLQMQQILGANPEVLFGGRGQRYAYLPTEKQAQLRRIEQDYDDMMSQIYTEQAGVQLPSDREKLKLLQAERKRDIEAVMTPEEREQYELHDSPTASRVTAQYGAALETEDDYRRIYALQKAFDERYANAEGPRAPEQAKERRAAEQQLQEQIDSLLTPDQRAALQRANDQDYTVLASLSQRLNLPSSATDATIALRATYATQSLAINADANLSPQERRTQLAALATKAQTELRTALGAEAADVYAQRANWLNTLRSGAAFSTNRKDATGAGEGYQGIYRVTPPRPALTPSTALPQSTPAGGGN